LATTTSLATTTTTLQALSAAPLSKVDPPHGSSHHAVTLAIIAIVAMLLVLAILGPEIRAWFDRNHPRTL
jgi:hypothetical protein